MPSTRWARENSSRRRESSPVPASPVRGAGARASRASANPSAQSAAALDGRFVPAPAWPFMLSGAGLASYLHDRMQGHEAPDGGDVAEDRDHQRGEEQR